MAEKGQSSVLLNGQITGPEGNTRTLLCDANGALHVNTAAPAGAAQQTQEVDLLTEIRDLLVQIEINTRAP